MTKSETPAVYVEVFDDTGHTYYLEEIASPKSVWIDGKTLLIGKGPGEPGLPHDGTGRKGEHTFNYWIDVDLAHVSLVRIRTESVFYKR
jgi:hypothetical protein